MNTTHLFVGCYTHRSPAGIHTYAVSDADGQLTTRSSTRGPEHASFLAAHPHGRIIYAVSELDDHGEVVALRIDPDDVSMTEIDRVPSHGSAPCHVSVDTTGRHAYVANYGSGSIAAYALEPDGRFGELMASVQHEGSGPHPRQAGPHAHSVVPDPRGSGFYAVDLGIDAIHHYEHRLDGTGLRLAGTTTLAPGSGPRHMAFHPRHPLTFVVGELDSTLICLDVDQTTGVLHPSDTRSTLPDAFAGESIAADVHVHPNGRFVYVSNRGHDSIATFALSEDGAEVTMLGHHPTGGQTPRNFAIHPDGKSLFVANQDTNTIVSMAIEPTTGRLSGGTVVADVNEPVCLVFVEHSP